jgi:hypothetical protein
LWTLSASVATQVIADDGQQAGLERFVGRGNSVHVFDVLAEPEKADLFQRLFFRIEVVIKTALLDTEPLGNITGGRAVKPLFGKNARGGTYGRLVLRLVTRIVGIFRLHPGLLDVRNEIL